MHANENSSPDANEQLRHPAPARPETADAAASRAPSLPTFPFDVLLREARANSLLKPYLP